MMKNFSRREFIKKIGFLTTSFPLVEKVYGFAVENDSFEFLVVGDSLIFGQGLQEKDKFYRLTKNWLEKEFLASRKTVNLKVKAHSGATITLDAQENKALQKAGIDIEKFLYPEVNVSFPTIWSQLKLASEEYANPQNVNLIMLTGSITDISVAKIINPFESNKKLQNNIKKYCFDSMFSLLEYAVQTFPNAKIAVVGYYPMISKKSLTKKIFNTIMELYKFPSPVKPLVNNVLSRPLLRLMRKNMIRRSLIWAESSNRELQSAVNRLNEKTGKKSAIFIKSPLDENHSYGARKTLLWEVIKKSNNDDFYEKRTVECEANLADLRKRTGLTYRTRFCELAAIGHPNVEGSKAYAEKIKAELQGFL